MTGNSLARPIGHRPARQFADAPVIRRLAAMFAVLFLVLVSGLPATAQQKAAPAFETKAAQAYLIEASTGTILLSKNPTKALAPASLAKMMTLEVVFDALKRGEVSLDTIYKVSEHAWRTGGAPSRTSTMFAALNSLVRVEDLLKGVAVQMANDGCIVLAEGMAGSEEKFAERMNARAAAIGLTDTHFANPTGLPDPANRTSVKDMVTLARYLKTAYPDYYRLLSLPDFEWNKIYQRNRNPMLAAGIGADGLATGFAEGEGFSILTSAEQNGRRLFLVMGGLATDKDRREEAVRLLKWGFENFEMRTLFKAGETIGQASVYGGDRGKVDLVAAAPVEIYVPVTNPERLSARIVYRWPLDAPVSQGQDVGTLRITAGDRLLREVPLKTAAAVGPGTLRQKATDALIELLFFWL
ncbi:D-alanyl-D-alanine carboxypeptidase (penicillin-binding protein 5/6) [Ciceribacter lividus]|uniref:serine-type D-Ala-D-Ala carboxypeptidase n=2 Tax=Ciceribacter lividus TaxID=1197950 RepID=A0A6I7HTJ4_9HYPH|nr:D-alanyl-D-alanine carboxypeptidase (penicillin-binding protein 5/6) [Ciceribacter lividus]